MDLARPYNIAITGVGGTGVLTIGAILGMAAHLEGKASMILDMAGLAQKGGAVLSHEVTTPRIVTGGADLLIAADSVVAASKDGIALCDPDRTMGVVNTHLTPVADFVRNRSFDFREAQVLATVRGAVRAGADFEPFSDTQVVSAPLFLRSLCLPSGSNMTEAEQDRVIAAIRAVWMEVRH